MNLDNKYSKLQIYNKKQTQNIDDNDDDNNLADFLSDMKAEDVKSLTGIPDYIQEEQGSEQKPDDYYRHTASAAFISNYDLILKQFI